MGDYYISDSYGSFSIAISTQLLLVAHIDTNVEKSE